MNDQAVETDRINQALRGFEDALKELMAVITDLRQDRDDAKDEYTHAVLTIVELQEQVAAARMVGRWTTQPRPETELPYRQPDPESGPLSKLTGWPA